MIAGIVHNSHRCNLVSLQLIVAPLCRVLSNILRKAIHLKYMHYCQPASARCFVSVVSRGKLCDSVYTQFVKCAMKWPRALEFAVRVARVLTVRCTGRYLNQAARLRIDGSLPPLNNYICYFITQNMIPNALLH